MDRRKKFQEKHEPTKVPKAELERHFFFCDDKISMSLEYFDTEKSKNNNNEADGGKQKNSNPNKRYLSCPGIKDLCNSILFYILCLAGCKCTCMIVNLCFAGTVKIQHLMKFITMKYGLNSESFVVDVIYKGDIIPQDYTLIDVAYYYKWEKDAPMQFFYRIFKHQKVLLKRRKRKSLCEDKISDPKKARTLEVANNVPAKSDNTKASSAVNNKTVNSKESSKNGDKENDIKNNSESKKSDGARTVNKESSAPPSLVDQTKKEVKKVSIVENNKVEEEKPPTLKPAFKEDIKMDTSEDEDDTPPSEKKLKIDLKPENNENKVSSTPPKIEPITIPEIKKKQQPELPKEVKKQVKETKEEPVKSTSSPSAVKPCIPKLINTTSNGSNKTKPNMLNNIVNNLTKKLTESGSPPPPVKPAISKPPSTLLGGQTTITKKDANKSESKDKIVKESSPKVDEKKPKGIPSATSVTLKTMKSPSSTSNTPVSGVSTMSFSNSFKSKNGSMMDFVQPNGLTSPTKKNSSSTLSDLRTFRKDSTGKPKSPITPSLTSRTLTLGSTKKSSSPSTSSTSSFTSTLTKPLPKPGEASSANNLLAAHAQINALASLGLTTASLNEAQKEYIKNLTAAAALFQPQHHPFTPPSQQLPSNRLKLTMQTSKNSTNPLQMLPSLASHMAPESQWKSFTGFHGGSHGSSNGSTSSGSKLSSLSKTLNQSIRQIPNPSLLTKQASEQQQLLQVQRALAASAQAAAISSGAAARGSLSQ